MARLACAFARRLVLLVGEHRLIGSPEVAVEQGLLIALRDTPPQKSAGGLAAVADGEGDDLAGPSALGEPHPLLVFTPQYERPHLVEFENVVLLSLR